MTADQIAVASELVRTWKAKKEYTLTKESALLNDLELELEKPLSEITAGAAQPALQGTGRGFVVDQSGPLWCIRLRKNGGEICWL
jgi:hypothetical protein